MNWTGRSSLVLLVAVLALAVTGLLPGGAQALDRQGATPLYYSSFPVPGGPYITAATYQTHMVTPELHVVFNEEIDPATVDLADFTTVGFTAANVAVDASNRFVVLSNFTGAVNAGADSVYLADVGVIDDAAGAYTNSDVGHVAVSTGPAIIYAEIDYSGTMFYTDDDVIDVYFDDPVAIIGALHPFADTPELAGAEFDYTVAGNRITVELDGTGDTHFRQTYRGISKIWLADNTVEWTGNGVNNSTDQKRMLENEDGGPILMGCYFNPAADAVWLVFSEAVDPSSLYLDDPDDQYNGVNYAFGASATQALAFPGEFTNCVLITDEGFTPALNPFILVDTNDPVQDYQGEPGDPDAAQRAITTGFGLIRVVYDDGGTVSLVDDRLEAWFSEEFETLGNVDSTDFHVTDMTDSLFVYLTLQATNESGLGHVVFTGWHVADAALEALDGRLPVGHKLYIDTASNLQGVESSTTVDRAARLPIFEGYKPAPTLDAIPSLTNKTYDAGPPIVDMAYLAWRELAAKESGIPDNSDEYFLFSTWTDPSVFTDSFIETYFAQAIPVGNIGNGLQDGGVSRYGLSIQEGLFTTSDGYTVNNGDQIYFMLVPCTYWGEMGRAADALIFDEPFVPGPVCPPRDYDSADDNLIHVAATYDEVAEEWTRRVWGDTSTAGGAAPCGDSLYVMDDTDPLTAEVLGVGPINANGSFGPIYLTADANDLETLYLFAYGEGAFSEELAIVNDIVDPALETLNMAGQIDIDGDGDPDGDLFNPYRIYKADDYVNIITMADDRIGDPLSPTSALSDLLALTADFTAVDEAATYSGEPVSAIPFVSLGADRIDNDGDWDDLSPNPTLNGNGVRNFPEPYFDENGDGNFDPGETFVDVDGDGFCDCIGGSDNDYDFLLDSADPDEHSWYEIQLTEDYNDVTKGFQIADPITDALGLENFAEIMGVPVDITVIDEGYDVETVYADDEAPFVLELDEAEPSVVYMTEIYNLGTLTEVPVPADNLWSPTDPTYNLGRYMSFTIDTPSDWDVLFCTTEIDPGTGTFERLTLDPPGVNADTDAPGVEDFDDDRDVAAFEPDGIDQDEDGTDGNEGEGWDYADAEVVDASQTEAEDAAADGSDGVFRQNDRRDNDNDAFFVFEPYFDPAGGQYQRIVWYNIDESTTNGVDDDNDGSVDEAGETESYDPEADDNEDGIVDGEAIELTADAVRMVCAFDDTYTDAFYVDAAHVLGAARDGEIDIRGLTEIAAPAWEVLDPNGVLSDAYPGLPWGDSLAYGEFDWNTIHAENIDLWHIAKLYDLTTDGSDHGYRMRALGYDHPGNVNADYSAPFTFTLDTTPPDLTLEDCVGGTEDDPSLTGPPEFMAADADADEDGVQLFNSGTYTLTTEDDGTAVEAAFQYRTSTDGGVTWTGWGAMPCSPDPSRPFTCEFDAGAIVLCNDPPDASVFVQFRAYGKDEFENWQEADEACVFEIEVIDGTPGTTWFRKVYNVCNDTDGLGETPPCDPTDDVPYWYRDVYGPVRVPVGPTIDLWADFDDNDTGCPADSAFNDVIRVVFEMRPAGEGHEWTHLSTITGEIVVDPGSGDTLSCDFTRPVAVTLDTEWLAAEYGTGSFDLRVYCCDIEGNCNILTADVVMITIVPEGLRAYIEPPVNTAPLMFNLYAVNYIHDYDIDYVTFEYFEDLNGNGLDDSDDRASGSDWYTIAVDNAATGRADVLLYRGSAAIQTLAGRVGFAALGGAGGEGFIDYDGDGYSDRDPIIRDTVAPFGTYNAGDVVVVGSGVEILSHPAGLVTLTAFDADEFHSGAGTFDTSEWIFQENGMQASGTLQLWQVAWNATGLEGNILVRSVATDETGAVDDNGGVTIPSVIPMEELWLDTVAPTAAISEFVLSDGTSIPASTPDIYVSGSYAWMQVAATTPDTDVASVLFQYSTNGGTTWTDLDINDDNDFFAEIDGVAGFSDEDEVILDDGDFVYGAADVVLYAGDNGVVDTPLGTPLIPLTGEDPAGSGDEDGDGMVDEDGAAVPEDRDAAYFVYFVWPAWISDTNVLFHAVAEDESGNVDPDPEYVLVIIGESTPPETDVISVLTADETEVDVWPTLADGDGVTQLEGGTVAVHVTAEDASAIDHVDLMWRFAAGCYPDLDAWENPWRSMADDGVSAVDDTYPYNFDVDLDAVMGLLGDVVIEFYPQAVDDNGNATPPPANPYLFRLLGNYAYITPDYENLYVAPGDEFWFQALLNETPDAAEYPWWVGFYYAERVLDEAIDATRITPDPVDPTYMTLQLENEMAASPGDHAELTIDGTAGTYHADLSVLAAPTMYDWTWVDDGVGTGHIEFGAVPGTEAEIVVSYNVTGYSMIGAGDEAAPFTVAWDQGDGGVPYPTNENTDAYDVIARLYNGMIGDEQCGMAEAQVTEGQLLMLVNEDAPEVTLFPYGLRNASVPPGAPVMPTSSDYWPGNPSFDSVAGLTEWKLSGVEHEFFAVAADTIDAITGVALVFTQGENATTVPMTLIDENQDHVAMTFTLYESDFPFVPYAFENVWLETESGFSGQLSEVSPGVWQIAGVPVAEGSETEYRFWIDMDGDDYDTWVVDPRNWDEEEDGDAGVYSSVSVPDAPFYYASGIDFGDVTAVWHVRCQATDEDGNVGVDGPLTFVYDPVAPTVDAVTASSLRFNSAATVDVMAQVTDPVPPTFDVITVDEVIFQYCPNYYETDQLGAHVWVAIGTDTDPSDGWILPASIPAPATDGFDNDGDEDWDEADEATSRMAFRALAMDDGHNIGEPMILEFVLDDQGPTAEVTNPVEGLVYAYGTTFDVTATAAAGTNDAIAYVLFQFNAGDGWTNIDITPEDNSDHPWDATAPYAVSFNTTDYLDEEDVYVRFRAVAVDLALNQGVSDEVLVVVNDITGPTAFLMTARTSGGAVDVPLTDPHCAVTGHGVLLKGIAVDPSGAANLATITVQYWDAATEEWVTIDVVNDPTVLNATTVAWEVTWDTVSPLLPEGVYTLRALATDIDGNFDPNPDTPDVLEVITVSLRVDHTAPSVFYTFSQPLVNQDQFAPFDEYENNGDAASEGRAVVPEWSTGDLNFIVITPDEDVSGMVLEYRYLDDPLGTWRAWTDTEDELDFEPNLTFESGRTPNYVWWRHIDDFADHVTISDEVELRVLATDYAGNSNILHNEAAPEANPWEIWTIDTDLPYQQDFNNDLTANQVASGDPVTLTAVMSDSTTDVVIVRFEYRDVTVVGAEWQVIDPNPATPAVEAVTVTGENIDTPYARWTGQVTWTTPLVYWDKAHEVRAVFYDTAGNEGFSATMTITVEDEIAPALTKLYAIAPETHWVDWVTDGGDAPGDSAYVADCENQDHDGLFVDHNGNHIFNLGTDLAVDYGLGGTALYSGAPAIGVLGDDMYAWPRFIDETMIDNELDLYVSHEVTLVGRTQIFDIGLAKVEFWAVPRAGAGEPILIATDECPPAYGWTYLWHVFWNTREVDVYGDPRFPDGEYRIVLIAEDLEGNRETWTDGTAPTVWVDNTAPEATADANALTETIETSIEVERNDVFQLFARTQSETADDAVYFWVKRARDLNMTEAWWMPDEGVDDSDINPDWTRPFVFDWDMNAAEMRDDSTTPPLPVGEVFEMAAAGCDFLGNTEAVTDVRDDERFITMTIVDTQAPVPTITEVARITGDVTPIVHPHLMDAVHARDLSYLTATLLEADNDCERVEFMFMPLGGTEPTLIDADIQWSAAAPYVWTITSWDLAALAPGSYRVWARGWDDVGNHADGPQFTLVVDYTAPTVAVVTPTSGMMVCPDNEVLGDGDTSDWYYELIFTSLDTDIWDDSIGWAYKRAQDPDAPQYWRGLPTDILFDADSGGYAGRWSLYGMTDGLYDVRLTVSDNAGNEMQEIVARNVVIDRTDPVVDVTRVTVGDLEVYPTAAVDISLGDVITLWATAHDEEDALPDDYETGVSSMIFEARRTAGADLNWYELGQWEAPEGTIYTEVAHSIDWNTTGLLEGTYEVRVWADDVVCNEAASGAVSLGIFDIHPPRARICGFQPWRETHGDERENFVDIFGCAYSDTQIDEVQFQYSTDAGESWIPIGIARRGDDDGWLPTEECDLWFTSMTLDGLGEGTQFHLRALATDGDLNQDDAPPTLLVKVIKNMYGQLELEPAEDLGLVSAPLVEYKSSDADCEMIITVTMTDATQTPQALMISPASELQFPNLGYQYCIEMVRMVDNPLMWRGVFDMPYGDDEECGRYTVFVNALKDGELDLHYTHQWTWEVTDELGSNGVMSVPGYLAQGEQETHYLYASAWIPPGNDMSDYCFLIAPCWTPQLNQDEAWYLEPLARTSYHIGLACDYDYADYGFWGEVTIEYDDAALLAACGGDAAEAALKEAYITVRAHDSYDEEAWTGEYIQQISVDVENNKVTFIVTEWDYDEAIYALFVPKWNGPVVVRSFDPRSPYAGRWNYTDRDPIIVIDLNGYGNEYENVEEETIQIWIDGNLVATGVDDEDNDPWVQGEEDGADFVIEAKDADDTLYQLTYTHGKTRTWWLAEGWHTLNVRYKTYDDYDYGWIDLPASAPGATFYVDATAPMVQLYSGWADDPILHNVNGYSINGWLNPDAENEMLTAYMYDAGAGILMCPTDLGGDDDDLGVKYDLWLVQPNRSDYFDDHYDPIDEVEHRVLLHTGTCTELEPYLNPPMIGANSYSPSDTLFVGLPIVAGGRHHDIRDNDILEVVFYTKKHVLPDITYGGCDAGLIILPGMDGEFPDTLGAVYFDCYVEQDGRLHVYDQGILDWAGNVGSEFVECRFVVDKTAPAVSLVTPVTGKVEPGEQFCFETALEDGGSGVKSATAVLKNAAGETLEVGALTVTDKKVTGCVEGGLPTGHYNLLVDVTDNAGNTQRISIPITVESAVLAVGDAHLVPNPVSPADGDGKVCFHLSRSADVTVKVFDFAGELVSTQNVGWLNAAYHELPWSAQAQDGTALANGAYLIRVEVYDGIARRAETIKAVIWRE